MSYGSTACMVGSHQEQSPTRHEHRNITDYVPEKKKEEAIHDTHILSSSLRSVVSPLTGDRATAERMTTLALGDGRGPWQADAKYRNHTTRSPVRSNPRPWYRYPPFRLIFHFGSYLNLSVPVPVWGPPLYAFPRTDFIRCCFRHCLLGVAPWKPARPNTASR